MAKITNFTWSEFWDIQDRHDEMLCDIEDRALEIARDMGESYQPHQVTDIFFQHDDYHEYIVIEFCEEVNGEETFEYFKINSNWLFSDDYKQEIDAKAAEMKRKEAEEYREYLRLKEKFEGKGK